MKTIAIFRTAGPNWVEGTPMRQQPYWDEHAAFMDALFESGSVYLAGPYADGSGAMVVYLAENLASAVAMQQDDPWLLHGIHASAGAKEWTVLLDGREKQPN